MINVLVNDFFKIDELIRQITINCLDRGILLNRIKRETEMTINSFQNLTDSAIAYGVRTYLNVRYRIKQNEEEKDKMKEKINQLTDENIKLKEYNMKLEEEIKARVERFVVINF
jgi:dynein light intermediate chain